MVCGFPFGSSSGSCFFPMTNKRLRILERLIAKLAEELRGGDNDDQASG